MSVNAIFLPKNNWLTRPSRVSSTVVDLRNAISRDAISSASRKSRANGCVYIRIQPLASTARLPRSSSLEPNWSKVWANVE